METFIEILKSVFMGIVQGITEWLPISSTGHLILFENIIKMNVSPDFFDMFKVVIQLGSILAVLLLFFKKLNPVHPGKTVKQRRETWNLWGKVLVASLPAAVVGLLIDDIIDSKLGKWYVIATALIVYGVFFIIMESRSRKATIKRFEDMNYKTALIIGVFQVLALIPGTSRSGATILGAVLLGCSRYIAAEFSFFMSIPVMFGASGLKLVKYFLGGNSITGSEIAILAFGFVTAFVVSVVVVKFFMNFIKKHTFKGFGYYRIALGVILIIAGICGFFNR